MSFTVRARAISSPWWSEKRSQYKKRTIMVSLIGKEGREGEGREGNVWRRGGGGGGGGKI
jgi:hypothetical protein